MLSEHRTLKNQVVVFMGPLNMSGFEAIHEDEIEYLTELAIEAGAIVGSRVNNLTTLCVTSELTPDESIADIPRGVRVLSEPEFVEEYLTEAITGEEWE
ncbi:MAG: hypothetical protein R3183_07885 [Oleiphilaceae bacterium]|nr:hypothetical protein [Oleiphilaceae bacterium]